MNYECLIELFGQDVADQILSMPNGQVELLKVIAATLGELNRGQTVIGVQAITADETTPQSFTVPVGATAALVTVYDNDIIFRLDGGDPAIVSTGHYVLQDTSFEVKAINDFKFIAFDNSSTAKIYVTYFK